jgi:hypothetical protein
MQKKWVKVSFFWARHLNNNQALLASHSCTVEYFEANEKRYTKSVKINWFLPDYVPNVQVCDAT